MAAGPAGRRHPSRSKARADRRSSPCQKELRCGGRPAGSRVLRAHRDGCGKPDGAPRKTGSHPGLGLRGSQSLSLVPDGSSENSCVRCDQVADLLGLVAELWEEADRLRSLREAERDQWNRALPSLREKQEHPPEKTQDQEDPVSSAHQAESSNLKEGGEWRQVHARGSRQTHPLPTSPSQVPLYNRYEALDVEGQSMGDGPSAPEVLPRSERPILHIMTTSMRRKKRVIVVGDSLLRGTEGPLCQAALS